MSIQYFICSFYAPRGVRNFRTIRPRLMAPAGEKGEAALKSPPHIRMIAP